jgi:prepilin-type N-terminal cleavage/methylation domain-containing protein
MWPVKKAIYVRGFTMVEMVIVIVVVGAIFAIGALVLGRAFESYDLTRKTTDVDWQGRVAMERMARELRNARSATATDLWLSGASPAAEIRFNDIDGNAVCFRLSGSTLQRSADGPGGTCGTTNPQPLADNVVANGLSFYYYRNDGTAETTTAANVYYITVTLQVTEGNITETYRVTVQPQRF